MGQTPGDQLSQHASFATTQWSVVLAAGREEDAAGAREALATLCQFYWQPAYQYVRRRTPSIEAAQDLTQEFFLRLLQRNTIAAAAPQRGRFRAFLLTCLKNFLANEHERRHAKKRAGSRELSFDWAAAESRLSWAPADLQTPDRQFEREWATTLLDRVVEQLRKEYLAAGKSRQFEVLKGALTGDQDRLPFEELAAELQLIPEAARQAAHRMRKRYRELLRREVAQTVADPREVDDEIRDLFAAFGD